MRDHPVAPFVIVLGACLAAEVALPWLAIWLSDLLVIDIPAWSLWLVFGLSPAIGLLALLIHWALRMGSIVSRVPIVRQGRH